MHANALNSNEAGVAEAVTDTEDAKLFFSRGVDELMDALYGLALRLTRNSANAEDLVADAVVKAWGAFDSLEDRSRFRPWLFRILHNCFISDYRKKSVRPVETTYDEVSTGTEDEISSIMIRQSDDFMHWWANPEKEFVNRLLGENIMNAIDSLPDAFRTTILLVNVEGLSYDDAAEVLGVPAGTVRSRMKRGRTLLQKALWEHALEAGLITEHATENANEVQSND